MTASTPEASTSKAVNGHHHHHGSHLPGRVKDLQHPRPEIPLPRNHYASDHVHPPFLPRSATSLGVRSEIELIKAHERPAGSLVIGTRASALALAQTYLVQATLASYFPENAEHFSVAPMSTAGDKNQTSALYLFGGKALWTQELEVALLEGAIDMIVHSCKDVPTALPDGCELGAVMKREDPRDCLVVKKGLPYTRLEDLPAGSVVGTSSVRRVAQLRRAFPKLLFADMRGNIVTRLSKLDAEDSPFTALILASAGLIRMNFQERITCPLEAPTLFYAVGQGALAIETRSNDERVRRMVAKLNDWKTSWRILAEREMLRVLEGGCSVPVGVTSTLTPLESSTNGSQTPSAQSSDSSPEEDEAYITRPSTLQIDAIIASLSGTTIVTSSMSREISSELEAEDLGRDVANDLVSKGGRQILEELGKKLENVDFKARHTYAVQQAMDRAKEIMKSPELRARPLPDSQCREDDPLPSI